VLFLTFAKGDYRAEASFVIEPTTKQVVPTPFDGYLEQVFVKIGDRVEADATVLATLDTSELRLELASARAEEAAHLKRASIARRKSEAAGAQIAEAEAAKVRAQIDLLEYKIEQASIRSTISGVVVIGDLERQLGAPLKTGDILFEVTPLDSLRAELAVPEDQIPDVRLDQIGALATASFPGDKIPFTVERINPVADVAEGRNVFKVFGRLGETREWLRPGMAGTAKITIDKRSYGWIWTRRLVNWVRMKLWL
jgi:multidrug resistance efflux pump